MGTIRPPEQAKLFAGIITSSQELAARAIEELKQKFGAIDITSPVIDFGFTEYYAQEMGESLARFWISFKELVDPMELAGVKLITNKLEETFMVSGKRRINIDPGYITPAKIVLASTKDFSHRIYLKDGIYAEVTLIYRHKKFIPLEWSYPDYQSKTAYDFFYKARETQQEQTKSSLK